MSKWTNDFKTAKNLVESILRDNEKTRGDEKELCLVIWEKQGLKLTSSQKTLFKNKKILSAETIGRARRQIQEMGLYRPSQEKYKQRHLLEKDIRSNIREY